MTSSDRDVSLWVCTKVGQQEVRGRELGRASSRSAHHSHPPGQDPEPYQRCSACRWTEITLVKTERGYTVVSEGLTEVEGEVPYGRIYTAETGEEAVRGLYRADRRVEGSTETFLPTVARKALTFAARRDPDIEQALRLRGFIR